MPCLTSVTQLRTCLPDRLRTESARGAGSGRVQAVAWVWAPGPAWVPEVAAVWAVGFLRLGAEFQRRGRSPHLIPNIQKRPAKRNFRVHAFCGWWLVLMAVRAISESAER